MTRPSSTEKNFIPSNLFVPVLFCSQLLILNGQSKIGWIVLSEERLYFSLFKKKRRKEERQGNCGDRKGGEIEAQTL